MGFLCHLAAEPLGPLLSGTFLSEAEGGGEPGPLWVSSVIWQLSPWGHCSLGPALVKLREVESLDLCGFPLSSGS